MKLVEGQVGFWKMLFHAPDKGRGHVTANLLNTGGITLMRFQIGLEPFQGRGVLPLGRQTEL